MHPWHIKLQDTVLLAYQIGVPSLCCVTSDTGEHYVPLSVFRNRSINI
jgi:hypothetical protein